MHFQRQRGEKSLLAMPFSSHSSWHSESALLSTVFINSKINMAAALTPGLEEPISEFTLQNRSFRKGMAQCRTKYIFQRASESNLPME